MCVLIINFHRTRRDSKRPFIRPFVTPRHTSHSHTLGNQKAYARGYRASCSESYHQVRHSFDNRPANARKEKDDGSSKITNALLMQARQIRMANLPKMFKIKVSRVPQSFSYFRSVHRLSIGLTLLHPIRLHQHFKSKIDHDFCRNMDYLKERWTN